jgi:NADPH:quinone reductase
MAAVCEKLGQPLVYRAWDIGAVSPKTVKIQVAAAGINFGDILQCQGKYQEKLDPPFVSGFECAGTVVEVGEDVKNVKLGDRVICIGQKGFAQHVIAPSTNIIPLPRSLPSSVDLAEAAALIASYGTAYLGLTSQGRVKAGETVLITAAAGGVGLASVDLAR